MPAIAGSRLAQTRSRLAITTRYGTDEDVTEAKRDHHAAKLEALVARAVSDAPPLTADQRARIAALLTGGGAS